MGKKVLIALYFSAVLIITFIGLFTAESILNENLSGDDKHVAYTVNERLKSIGYLPYVYDDPNPDRRGVTLYNKKLAYDGVNLYAPQGMGAAYLIDMEGNILHKWEMPEYPKKWKNKWRHVKMDEDGGIIVLLPRLLKLDWDSNIEWKSSRGHYHHDFTISEGGEIYALTSEDREISYLNQTILVRDHYITILSEQGELKRRISLYDLLVHDLKPLQRLLARKAKQIAEGKAGKGVTEIFHTNTIDIIDRDIGIAKEGDILLCIRKLDLIAVVDIEGEKLLWSWGKKVLQRPHHPSILDNGNILVFDNGPDRKYSRIVEYNPIKEEVVWEYKADPPESFHTVTRGGNQRLPNGNTLITETNKGRVFEVTEEGEIVWEFWVPHFHMKNDEKIRAVVYRMMRFDYSVFNFTEPE
jgi:hypothetical protein